VNATSTQDPISWRHTYVTSNQPENLEIPGSDRRVLLHISARVEKRGDEDTRGDHVKLVRHQDETLVKVQAQFLVDGYTTKSMRFLDQTVRVAHFDDCRYLDEEMLMGKITAGSVFGLVGLCVVISAVLLIQQRKKMRAISVRRRDDEVDLVPNMERGQSSTNVCRDNQNGNDGRNGSSEPSIK